MKIYFCIEKLGFVYLKKNIFLLNDNLMKIYLFILVLYIKIYKRTFF